MPTLFFSNFRLLAVCLYDKTLKISSLKEEEFISVDGYGDFRLGVLAPYFLGLRQGRNPTVEEHWRKALNLWKLENRGRGSQGLLLERDPSDLRLGPALAYMALGDSRFNPQH